jgi:hypothetical protein
MRTLSNLHKAIDQLNKEHINQIMSLVEVLLVEESDPIWHRLKEMPGIKLPSRWPPQFKPVEPLTLKGELASDQLIRERR